MDSETGHAVPFASIGIIDQALGTSSNLDGQFSLAVPGPVALRITCVGYESVTIHSNQAVGEIRLKPVATQLKELVVFGKEINPSKIVRKAFASIGHNFAGESFFQTFFYRHYCKDEENYGRLIEAFVDVWKQKGYSTLRSVAGQREALRVTQLRRSLDRTAIAQSHEPIAIAGALQTDLAAYQTPEESEQLPFYGGLSNLRMDVEDYEFTFGGITTYDGLEVYEIKYLYKQDALPGSLESARAPGSSGILYIATDSYAIIRAEEVRYKGGDTVRTSAFYRKYKEKFFPYRLIRDGGTFAAGKRVHWFHIDLMSVEISEDPAKRFESRLPQKEELLAIPYDSMYWKEQTLLKATPLENEIVRDLGGGKSLNQQFLSYRQYEFNTHQGGVEGGKKLAWLIDFLKGKRSMFLCFWSSDCGTYLTELEQFKRLNKKYQDKAAFVMVSLDEDEVRWNQVVEKFNFGSDGMIQYRVGSAGLKVIGLQIEKVPHYILIDQAGETYDAAASHPGKPLLEEDLKLLIQKESNR